MSDSDKLLIEQIYSGLILIIYRSKKFTTSDAEYLTGRLNRIAQGYGIKSTISLEAKDD